MSDLIPCPFCGPNGRLYTRKITVTWYVAGCYTCGMSFTGHTLDEAIAHWNTRYPQYEEVQPGEYQFAVSWANYQMSVRYGIGEDGVPFVDQEEDGVYLPPGWRIVRVAGEGTDGS